jgi:MFS family permease
VAIGWILGGYGLLTTAAAWVVSRVIDRFDVVRVYWGAMLLATALAAGLAVAPWLWLIAVLTALRSIPAALSRPLLFAHLARVVPAAHQTGVFGLFPTAGNVGALFLPLIAAGVASLGTGAALAIGALGHGVSCATGVKLGRVK